MQKMKNKRHIFVNISLLLGLFVLKYCLMGVMGITIIFAPIAVSFQGERAPSLAPHLQFFACYLWQKTQKYITHTTKFYHGKKSKREISKKSYQKAKQIAGAHWYSRFEKYVPKEKGHF